MKSRLAIAAFLLAVACPLIAQFRAPVRSSSQSQNNPNQANQKKNQQPCWQQAGIEKGAFQRAASIRQQANSEIQSVCSNSSLSAQQKAAQVREIREREHQQLESNITAQQRGALASCRSQRGLSNPAPQSHTAATSPCGEMPGEKGTPSKTPNSDEESDDH